MKKAENCRTHLVIARWSCKWKGISLPKQVVPPYFQDGEKFYDQEQIIKELYVSCFGISNLPVSLCAKLYKTPLITKAFENTNLVVRFMGEDLIVTLNVLPLCTSPVIVPEVVYFYRVGGGTSRYMPNMLNEFLALYEYKYEFALLYPMPYDVKKLMDIEIINIVRDYLCSFVIKGKSDKTKLHKEIQRIFDNLIINGAAKNIANNEVNGKVCNYICLRQSDEFADYILKLVRKNKWKSTLKKLLLSV